MCKQPNILLIMSDQQRTDTLGFMGRTPCQTPHLDRLARSGICFDRCLTPNPLCTPARAALFTGQYPHQVPGDHVETGERTNMMTNYVIMRAEPVLTDRLRERGYHCFNAGKWHLGDEVLGTWFDEYAGHSTKEYSAWCLQQGLPDGWAFNDMRVRSKHAPHHSIPVPLVQDLDPSQGNDAWITDHAIRFIESRPADKPFFGVCSLNGPHPPFVIPEPYFSMFDETGIPEPPNFGPGETEPAANRSSYYRKVFEEFGTSWEDWKKSVAVYWGFVNLIDAQIGRMILCLERQGILDETLVIFCSDHGEMLGQHGLWHKCHAYEEALRVPLIMSAPWISPGLRNQEPASLIDVAPTILATAGAQVPTSMEGLDLTSLFEEGGPPQERKFLFSESEPVGPHHGTTEWRMVTDNRFKYVWNRNDLGELFDLENDPYEVSNLIETSAYDAQSGLQTALKEWMQHTADPLEADFAGR